MLASMSDRDDLRKARHSRLWREWRLRGDAQARDRLIESLMPLADAVCQRRLQSGVPPFMDANDMTAAAYLALVRAVERFRPAGGASIESFVWNRCEGAVLDWLRGEYPGSRGLQEYERSRDRLHAKLGRDPSEADVAEALGLSGDQVRAREIERSTRWTVSLSQTHSEDGAEGDRAPLADTLVAEDRREDPAAALEIDDTARAVHHALRRLPENERTALVRANLEETPLRRVGEAMGISESRVSQLRSRAIGHMREQLDDQRELLTAA
jgi:RNA polymerase sigma factor for flagellar operon FliA